MNTASQAQIIRLAFELSQAKLAAQASAALGADARAMSFCGACLAAAALLMGLANGSGFPVSMYVAGFFMIIAAAVSGYSARPVPFYFPGNNYNNLEDDIKGTDTHESVLAVLGGFADQHIQKNSEILAKNSAIALVPQFLALA